ncbi:DUF3332 domain-containing protein [Myxococcaceae bacterium GXIMD 01537]
MRNRLMSSLTVLMLATVTVQGTGCFGSFDLTRKIYNFNKGASDNKFVRWLIFLGLSIIPVYEVGVLVDTLVLNSIEFWTGEQPMANAAGGEASERVVRLSDTDTLKLSRDAASDVLRVELLRAGQAPQVRYFEPLEDGLAVRDEAGALVLAAHEGADGALTLTDASGATRAVHSAEVVERAREALLEGGAEGLAHYATREAAPLSRALALNTCAR